MSETTSARRAWPVYGLLMLLSLPILLMYAWLIVSAFSYQTRGLVPVGGWTLDHWRFLWQPISRESPSVWQMTWNSLVYALAVTVLLLVVSTMAGYALSRLTFPGRRPLMFGTIVLHAFPSVTLLIAIFIVLRQLGLYNTIPGVVLVKMSMELPFGVWVMKGFFDNVSWDVEMAAMIDGCSRLHAFRRVVLPLVRPGIGALAIFAFLSAWNDFILPFLFLPGFNSKTLAVVVAGLTNATQLVDYGLISALSVFYMLPVIAFFLLTQKYLLSIYSGGVKG